MDQNYTRNDLHILYFEWPYQLPVLGRALESQPRHLGRVFETNFWPKVAEI